jgi:CRP/FNR family transcriptional regulator, cyclic AMP receptor protein
MTVDERHLGLIARSFGCDEAVALHIASLAQARGFPAQSVIIKAGDADPDAWLMLAGEARAIAYAPGGQFILVHIFLPGDMFGEATGLSVAATASEVTAVVSVEAARIAVGQFIALMEQHHCVALSVARALTRRLNQTSRRMVEGATLSAPGRIHAELLRQARASAQMTIRPAPVLALLALHVQSTRETVSRTINTLEKRGIIRRDAEALTIVAPHRLEELVY